MSKLRLASVSSVNVDMGDGDFIRVREDISKENFKSLMEAIPDDYSPDNASRSTADAFTSALFTTLLTGWSLDVPVTRENYFALDNDSANAVDMALLDYFNNKVNPTVEEKKTAKK